VSTSNWGSRWTTRKSYCAHYKNCTAATNSPRDVKDRDRFVSSPYAYICGEKHEKQRLFQDFLLPSPSACVLFSPPADPRLTVAAIVGSGSRSG